MPESINEFYWFGFSNQKNITKSNYSEYQLNATPLIDGRRVALDEALKQLKKIIWKRDPIHFDAMNCDQNSLSNILDLAEFSRSSINHQDGNEIYYFYNALSIHGGSLISFNELKKRSDLIFFIGYFDSYLIESFFKSTAWKKSKLKDCIHFFCSDKKKLKDKIFLDFLRNFNELSDLVLNDQVKTKFTEIKKKFEISKYPVFVLNSKNGAAEINEIFKLSEKLNKKGKKVRLFRFSGENNSSGFVNACITKTGFPCSVNFSDWGAYYDPEYYTARVQNKLKSTQLLFSNLISSPNYIKFEKNIFVGHPNFSDQRMFNIFIPVKTPGIDTDGLVVRSDGNSILKLEKKVESNYPTINQIIHSMVNDG